MFASCGSRSQRFSRLGGKLVPIGPSWIDVFGLTGWTWRGIQPAFSDLIIEYYARSTDPAADRTMQLTFNDDTSAVYDSVLLLGQGAAITVSNPGIGRIDCGGVPAAGTTAGYFVSGTVQIINYCKLTRTGSSRNVHGNSGHFRTGNNYRVWDMAGQWRPSTPAPAIHTAKLVVDAGTLTQGSWMRMLGRV